MFSSKNHPKPWQIKDLIILKKDICKVSSSKRTLQNSSNLDQKMQPELESLQLQYTHVHFLLDILIDLKYFSVE